MKIGFTIKKNKEIALVLSGGGARGLAHYGAIKELEQHGFTISSITGTSIGAVIGAMYAMGKLDEFFHFVQSKNQKELLDFMDLSISDHFQVKGKKLFDELKKFAPDKKIEQLPLTLKILATDMLSGNVVEFTSGSIYRAMRASISIPAVLVPVKIGTQLLADGGVVNPYPLDLSPVQKHQLLVGVNLYARPVAITTQDERESNHSFWQGLHEKWLAVKEWRTKVIDSIFSDNKISMGYLKTVRRMTDLMNMKMAEQASQLYRPQIEINIPLISAGLFDFHKAEELEQLGRAIAEKAILEYKDRNTWKNRLRRIFLRK